MTFFFFLLLSYIVSIYNYHLYVNRKSHIKILYKILYYFSVIRNEFSLLHDNNKKWCICIPVLCSGRKCVLCIFNSRILN